MDVIKDKKANEILNEEKNKKKQLVIKKSLKNTNCN